MTIGRLQAVIGPFATGSDQESKGWQDNTTHAQQATPRTGQTKPVPARHRQRWAFTVRWPHPAPRQPHRAPDQWGSVCADQRL